MKYRIEVYLKDTQEWLHLRTIDALDAKEQILYLKSVTGRRHRVLTKKGEVIHDTDK